jgi:hypothetical protein
MKWHYALRLLLEWLGPAGMERARPISAFRPDGEDRGFNPPSPARPRQSIPVGRRRLTGQGGAGEELRTKRNPWVAVGWKGAHHRGLVRGEGRWWRWLGPEVIGGEAVDVVKLQTRAVLLEVVARPEVLGRQRLMATCMEEEGNTVNLLVRRRWSTARAPTRC